MKGTLPEVVVYEMRESEHERAENEIEHGVYPWGGGQRSITNWPGLDWPDLAWPDLGK